MTTLVAPQLPLVARPNFTIEDWWDTALDGRLVHVEDVAYSLEILGIHQGVAGDVWIQVAPFDQADRDMLRADRGFTLHCQSNAAPHDALQALGAHLARHGVRHGGRLEVPQDHQALLF